MTKGHISAQRVANGLVLTAEAVYPVPLLIGTLAAIPIAVIGGPLLAVAAWLWLVGGNYLYALLALRSHLKKANANLVSAAT